MMHGGHSEIIGDLGLQSQWRGTLRAQNFIREGICQYSGYLGGQASPTGNPVAANTLGY